MTKLRDDFAVLGGFVDFLAPSVFIGAAGGITGLANIAPVRPPHPLTTSSREPLADASTCAQKTCLKLYRDTVASLSGKVDPAAAAELQGVVSRADWVLVKGGISGTKYALSKVRGYGGAPRRPILPFDASEGKGDKVVAELQEILKIENSL